MSQEEIQNNTTTKNLINNGEFNYWFYTVLCFHGYFYIPLCFENQKR